MSLVLERGPAAAEHGGHQPHVAHQLLVLLQPQHGLDRLRREQLTRRAGLGVLLQELDQDAKYYFKKQLVLTKCTRNATLHTSSWCMAGRSWSMVRMTPLWTRTGSTTRPWFSARLPGAAFFL